MQRNLGLLLLLTFLSLLLLSLVAADNLRNYNAEEEEDSTKPTPRPKPLACWKDGEARGRGVLPDKKSKTCPVGHPDKSMGLCYPACSKLRQEGFGPLCWDNCEKMVYKANGIIFCCDTDETCSEVKFFLDFFQSKSSLHHTTLTFDIF